MICSKLRMFRLSWMFHINYINFLFMFCLHILNPFFFDTVRIKETNKAPFWYVKGNQPRPECKTAQTVLLAQHFHHHLRRLHCTGELSHSTRVERSVLGDRVLSIQRLVPKMFFSKQHILMLIFADFGPFLVRFPTSCHFLSKSRWPPLRP